MCLCSDVYVNEHMFSHNKTKKGFTVDLVLNKKVKIRNKSKERKKSNTKLRPN